MKGSAIYQKLGEQSFNLKANGTTIYKERYRRQSGEVFINDTQSQPA